MFWEKIDIPDKQALVDWYGPVDDEDREKLAKLFIEDKFAHWACPVCGTDVLVGAPDDWADFPGVNQSEPAGQLCNSCTGKYLFLKKYAGS